MWGKDRQNDKKRTLYDAKTLQQTVHEWGVHQNDRCVSLFNAPQFPQISLLIVPEFFILCAYTFSIFHTAQFFLKLLLASNLKWVQ